MFAGDLPYTQPCLGAASCFQGQEADNWIDRNRLDDGKDRQHGKGRWEGTVAGVLSWVPRPSLSTRVEDEYSQPSLGVRAGVATEETWNGCLAGISESFSNPFPEQCFSNPTTSLQTSLGF